MKGTGTSIRLVKIEAENIKKLTMVSVRLDGEPGVFRVTSGGENEEGKTTFLNLIAMLFGGGAAVKEGTIQVGKDGGYIRGELTNGHTIERVFTKDAPKGYLTITTPEGVKSRQGVQTILDGWCGPHSWDPGALLRKRTAELEDIILGLAKDPDLKAKREDINTDRTKLQEDRKPHNKRKLKAHLVEKPEGPRPEAVNVSGEMERLDNLRARQRDTTRANSVASDCLFNVENKEKEVRMMAEALQAAQAELEGRKDTYRTALRLANEHQDHTEAIEAVETHIRDADSIRDQLGAWEEYERSERELKTATEESQRLTKEIQELDQEEEVILKAAEIPVRGISFSPAGDMLLDDHPIEQASGMRRLDMTCDIAFAADPQVRICLLDEADAYSEKSLEALHQRSQEEGFQVVACQLGKDGPGEIIIEDGHAKKLR